MLKSVLALHDGSPPILSSTPRTGCASIYLQYWVNVNTFDLSVSLLLDSKSIFSYTIRKSVYGDLDMEGERREV
jgi:hypothetical protein